VRDGHLVIGGPLRPAGCHLTPNRSNPERPLLAPTSISTACAHLAYDRSAMALRKPRQDIDTPRTRRSNAEYLTTTRNFASVYAAMCKVSIATADRYVDPRRGWASVLFTRLCTLCTSLNRLIAVPAKTEMDSDYWDYSSVATITRSILECYLLFHYLCAEPIDEEEFRDRLNLIHLHDCNARIALFRNLMGDEKQAIGFETTRAELLLRFDNSSFLKGKTERQRRHLLRGDKVMFEIQDEVLQRMGVDIGKFRAWYEVLSSHAHSYPLSFHRMLLDGRGNGVENNTEKDWTSLTLQYLHSFLARAVTEMLSLFPDVPDPRLSGLKPRVDRAPFATR
jgi:hypothetical protein